MVPASPRKAADAFFWQGMVTGAPGQKNAPVAAYAARTALVTLLEPTDTPTVSVSRFVRTSVPRRQSGFRMPVACHRAM